MLKQSLKDIQVVLNVSKFIYLKIYISEILPRTKGSLRTTTGN